MSTQKKQSSLFIYLLFLTLFFIFLEFSLILQYSQVYFNDFSYITDRLKMPTSVYLAVSFFVLVQIAIYLLFTFIVWALARLIAIALHFSWKKTEKLGFSLWVFCIITVLLANQCLAPNSKLGILTEFIIPQKIAVVLLDVALVILLVAIAIAARGLFAISSRKMKSLASILLLALISIGYYSFHFLNKSVIDAATQNQPNIILIGIDSLRPDFLGFFGYEKQSPHMDEFLNHASVFSDSLTPLARTFPAWVSILTGQYPKHNGARTNLTNRNEINLQNTLPAILRQQGYETIFATDETRFSNITSDFGFDSVITPPLGINDFLIGTINDFPMSNILINTPLGKYLFPYSYGNRPVSATYDPNSFLHLLKPSLQQSRQKPVFLAVHLCLPHTPYYFGTEVAVDGPLAGYQASLRRVDQQFYDLLAMLKENNLLEHSIVVLLSDHGEAIELPGDRVTEKELFVAGDTNKNHSIPHFYPPSSDDESLNKSVGHGTDVLGLTQYHNVLAFRLYGLEKNNEAIVSGLVSLLDIKPTLLDLTHQTQHEKFDGSSLAQFILGKETAVPTRQDFFTESDFSPEAIRSVHPETREVLFQGIEYFEIDQKTSLLTVRKSMENLINSSKQYADFYDNWVLALYPQSKTLMMPILVNLKTGQWTNDLSTSFAKTSPAQHMLAELKRFYGDDITQIQN